MTQSSATGADLAAQSPVPDEQRAGRDSAARWVAAVAYGMIAMQLAWRGWASYRGYFWQDDFVYIHRATTQPLGLDYLLQDYNGHLMPGQFLVVWLLSRLAPMDHAAAVTVILVLQAVASVAAYRLFRQLFATPALVLLPLAVFLFSPLTLTAFLWFAAAMQAIPLQIAMLLALLAQARYLRSGRFRDGLLGVLATAVGLLFWQKALLVIPVVFAVTALFFARTAGLRRLTSTARAHSRLWLAYGGLALAYLAVYAVATRQQELRSISPAALADLVYNAVLATFLPGLLGGPWSGELLGPTMGVNPSQLALWLSWQLAALVVLASILWRGWPAIRAWSLLAGYLAIDIALVAANRLDFIGPLIGRDPRYITDAVLVAALALGFAFRPEARDSASARARARRWEGIARHPAAIGAVLLVYINASAITSLAIAESAPGRDVRNYVAAARAAIAQDPALVLFDGPAPNSVLLSLFGPDARVSRVLGPLPDGPRFDQPTGDLRMLDDDGQARPVQIEETARARTGPAPGCGWPVRDAGATVPLATVAGEGRWALRLGYYTRTATRASARVGDRRYEVVFDAGLHHLYLVASGPLAALELSGLDRGAAVCVTDVVVGRPTPVQPPRS